MSQLVFNSQISGGQYSLDESNSGITYTALGEVIINLPSTGVFSCSFVCSNSTEENPVSITILAPTDLLINGGGQNSANKLVMQDYSFITLNCINGYYYISMGYGNVNY